MVLSLQPCIDRKLARYLQALQGPVTPLAEWLTTTTEPLPSSTIMNQFETRFSQFLQPAFDRMGFGSDAIAVYVTPSVLSHTEREPEP